MLPDLDPGTARRDAPIVRSRAGAALISLGGSSLGTLLTIIKGILFVPFYLRLFGTEVYGAWLATGNVVGLLGLFDAGITSVAYQRLGAAWGAGDRARFSRTAAAAAALIAGVAALIVVSGFALSPVVPKLVRAPESAWPALSLAFLLAACGSALTIAVSSLIAIPTSWQKTELGAAARLGGQLVETAVIGTGLWLRWGVVSLGLGSIVGAVVSLVICVAWTAAHWRHLELQLPRLHRSDLADLSRATLPLMISRVVAQIDGNIEIALVSAFISPASAAIYGITDRIFRTAVSFVNPIAGSVMGGLAHLVGERGPAAALKPSRELVAIWSVVVAASLPPLLAVNADFTLLWVGGDHYGGLPLSAALFISELLAAREWLFSVLLIAAGAISSSAWIATAECLVRMPIMYLAIRRLGWVGLPGAQAVVSLLSLGALASLAGARFGLAGKKSFRLFAQGSVPLLASVALGLLEAVALPAATTWLELIVKCALVGTAHLLLTLTLAPDGRRALFSRLATGRLRWLQRFRGRVG